MKTYELFVGIDISKLTLDFCMIRFGEPDIEMHLKVKNCTDGFKEALEAVSEVGISPNQTLFCMENTGYYGMPLACHLSAIGAKYWVVPGAEMKRSKGISRGKSDKRDAKEIALYAYTHQHKVRCEALPEEDILKLQLLHTERDKMVRVAHIFKMTDENEGFLPSNVLKEVKHTAGSIQRIKILQARLEERMLAIIKRNPIMQMQFKLITTVPGIGPITAIYLIIVTRCFKRFTDWRKLACYAGIAPFEYSSGSSIRGAARIHPMGNRKLKGLLGNGAIKAIGCDAHLKEYYQRKLSKGKHHMLIVNAVKCKILSRVFAVIRNQMPYVPTP